MTTALRRCHAALLRWLSDQIAEWTPFNPSHSPIFPFAR